MDHIWRKHKRLCILIVVVMILCLMLVFRQISANRSAEQADVEKIFASEAQTDTQKEKAQSVVKKTKQQTDVVIDIKGAVRKPGIYHMRPSDRVSDAIGRAGGFTDRADRDQINLARKLSDEMVIYVPEKGEQKSLAQTTASAYVSEQEPGEGGQSVNINTADEQGMQDLPGIGPAKAKAIVQYREEHGPFQSVDELTEVSGIGEKSLEKIRPTATVE